jgi:hypothetical protein
VSLGFRRSFPGDAPAGASDIVDGAVKSSPCHNLRDPWGRCHSPAAHRTHDAHVSITSSRHMFYPLAPLLAW